MRPLIALISLLAAAAAQAGGAECNRQQIAAMDADGDGAVSRDEAKSHPWLAGKFDTVDANKDGRLEQGRARRAARSAPRGHEGAGRGALEGGGHGRQRQPVACRGEASSSWVGERFDKLDANADGELTREEMHAARKQGHEQMRADMASSASRPPMPTATAASTSPRRRPAMPKLAEKFSTVDADNDGKVTADELKSLHRR